MTKLNQRTLENDILALADGPGGITYHDLCLMHDAGSAQRMQIDRTLQKLRRGGKIEFSRSGSKIVWRLRQSVVEQSVPETVSQTG